MENKQKGKSKLLIILVIILLLVLLSKCISVDKTMEDTVTCSYCGKVIRSNGNNIHCTTLYNGGTLKCDYCGHKTKGYSYK